MRSLLAAGAAAGLAAAFNAPLAAILFVIEETRKQFRYTLRSYTVVIIASTASAVGMELVGGTAPQLKLDNAEMPLSLLPAFFVLGVFLGGLGIVFNRTLLFLLDWVSATFRKVPFVPALVVGAAIGALALVLPQAVGGGELLIPGLVTGNLPIQILLLLCLLRFVGVMVSYPVGVPGGIFAPLLTLATTVGLIVACVAPDGRAIATAGGCRFRHCRDGRPVLGVHSRAAGRCRAGGRADERLRVAPAADRHLRDGQHHLAGAGWPATL